MDPTRVNLEYKIIACEDLAWLASRFAINHKNPEKRNPLNARFALDLALLYRTRAERNKSNSPQVMRATLSISAYYILAQPYYVVSSAAPRSGSHTNQS